MARDGGDDRLLDLRGELRPGLDEGVGVGLGEGERRHLLDVGASGEGLLRAGEDDDRGLVRGVEGAEGLVELVYEGGAEGVKCLGAVEGY